jgi:GT2 family glycosyltransferase
MLYIGDRPTLTEFHNKTIEVNIFDFDKDLYGDKLQIELLEKIREDKQFDDLEGLKSQLRADKEASLRILQNFEKKLELNSEEKFPSVGVVILNWNGKDLLNQFLPSIMDSDYPNLEIIVADNASDDDSIKFLNEKYPSVKVIQLEENFGFAKGYNQALKKVTTDYYVLLNSDVEVSKNWIRPIIKLMERNKKIGAVQPKIKSQTNKNLFEYAGASGGWIDYLGYPFCRGRILSTVEEDNGQYDDIEEIFWASGAALFIRPQLFHGLEGFDETYFAHMEEIDLCWRLQNAGYEIWVEPKSVCYHVGGGTLGKENPRKTYLNFRNNLYMMSKNLPLGDALIRIFLRMIIDGQAAIKELLSGNTGFFKAILRAHFHFYLHSPKTFAKRKSIPVKRKFTSLPGVYSRSIVLWYYARRKRKFSDLPE